MRGKHKHSRNPDGIQGKRGHMAGWFTHDPRSKDSPPVDNAIAGSWCRELNTNGIEQVLAMTETAQMDHVSAQPVRVISVYIKVSSGILLELVAPLKAIYLYQHTNVQGEGNDDEHGK
jgi:hypothetical protein